MLTSTGLKLDRLDKFAPPEYHSKQCVGRGVEFLFTNAQLKKLIIPLLIEQTLAVLVGMADTIMISYLGEAAVSGVSLVDMVSVVLINAFAALATGGAVVAAQMLGARKPHEACRSSNQLLIVVFAISMVLMLAMLGLREHVLRLLFGSIEDEVMKNALVYLEITALSYPFIALYNAGAALFRSMNQSRVTMYIALLMNAINCIGNCIGLFVFHMGVEGVAIPTLISRIVAAVVILRLLARPNQRIHLVRNGFRPDLPMIRRILHIGLPNGIENALFQSGRVLVVSIIATFGTVQVAANAVANTMDTLGVLPGQAMNLAIITVIGQCVGARDLEQVKFYTRKLIKWTYLFTLALNIPLLLSLPLTIKIFHLTPDTLDLACKLIWIHNGFAMLMWPIAFTLPNALRACNDVRFSMVLAIASMLTFRILFSHILGVRLGWGAMGVWWAMILDWCCRCTGYLLRYHRGAWKRLALGSS